ncbi:MAG: hypothetical protein WBW58_12630 [Candidatus Acidiferrum sp.]
MRVQRSIRFLFVLFVILAIPAMSFAQFGVSITVAPPELVAYSQPICPQVGYLWTPGYWGYGEEGYYWVPGTWVEPPSAGLLWTPGYWGWRDNAYVWNEGYWGPTVGFYGGVDYGYGYGGSGYEGGYWRNNEFNYNRSVNNVDERNFHHTYEKRVNHERAGNYVSYNGGRGGTTARASAAEETAAREHRTPATAAQTEHQRTASGNRELLASVNHGKPAIAATSKPGEFTGKGVVAATGARAAGNKATEKKSADNNRAAEERSAAARTKENKATEKKSAENNRAAEERSSAARTKENKATEKKSADNDRAA